MQSMSTQQLSCPMSVCASGPASCQHGRRAFHLDRRVASGRAKPSSRTARDAWIVYAYGLDGIRSSSGRPITLSDTVNQQQPLQHSPAHSPHVQQPATSRWQQRAVAAALAAAAAAAVLMPAVQLVQPPAATAADAAKVGTCLLSRCQRALAQCIGDATCLQDLVCLNLCNGAKDETACQIRCGDLYSDTAIDTFNSCAVSEQKCVPQRVDEGVYPVPPPCALDSAFDLAAFTGRWYITAGLNPLFDTFDCQEHVFAVPEPGKLVGRINWRIAKPAGDFVERSVVQMFKQDPEAPAVLANRGNPYLHYEDEWYILGSKPDSYVFVYYRGNNDAWKGYGGAVVYTRAKALPQELLPELRTAAEAAGLKWEDFKLTDNTCGPHPPKVDLVEEVEEELGRDASKVEAALEGRLRSFGRGFTVLESRVEAEVLAEERKLAQEVAQAEAALQKVEESLAREAAAEEKVVERELSALEAFLQRLGMTAKTSL